MFDAALCGRCFSVLRAEPIYSSLRNTRDLSHKIRAQSEIWLHREYNLEMKNKSLCYTMLHWSIVTHAQARRIALRAQWKAL